MKRIISIFLIGMLIVLIGCFLFINFDGKMTGRMAMYLGWFTEILAIFLLVRYFRKKGKQRI
ncbi:hypothetical protein [Dyadobacter sp. 3J3]|uniref:hypothetical protein n=1 Tax=Dyadobacter sp. 3J3 TaxID=2606600 RepID=UPI0013569AD6|nr:hypothetical protein [Dyadobacter sp. 3J3]